MKTLLILLLMTTSCFAEEPPQTISDTDCFITYSPQTPLDGKCAFTKGQYNGIRVIIAQEMSEKLTMTAKEVLTLRSNMVEAADRIKKLDYTVDVLSEYLKQQQDVIADLQKRFNNKGKVYIKR